MASADNNNHSNPSSEISIEEIVADDVANGLEEQEEGGQEAAAAVAPDVIPDFIEEIANPSQEDADDEETSVVRTSNDGAFNDEDEDDDDFEDETLLERLAGLTEMFPASFRYGTHFLASSSVSGAKWLYASSRGLSWIVFSSASILFLPIMIETERMGIEEAQKAQQRQILLGPGAAMSGGGGINAPMPM